MKKKTKNILIVAGIIGLVLGITGAIPSFLQSRYGVATASVGLIILGLILLAIGYSD